MIPTHFQIPPPPAELAWKPTKLVSYKTAQAKAMKDPVGTLYWQIPPDKKKSYMYLKLGTDLWLCLGDKKVEGILAEWAKLSKKPPKEGYYGRDHSIAQVISVYPDGRKVELNRSKELIVVSKTDQRKLKKQKRPGW